MRNKENKWWGVNNEVRIRRGRGSGGRLLWAQGSLPDQKNLPGKNQKCLFIIGSHNTISQLCLLLPLPEGCGGHSTWMNLLIALVLTYHTLSLSSLCLPPWGLTDAPSPRVVFSLAAQCAVGPSTDASSDVRHLLTVSILPAAKQFKSFILKQIGYIMV